MKLKIYQSAFVAFLLLFQAKLSFAVIADANIIEAIRLSKFYKLKVLNEECNDIQQELSKSKQTPVSRERTDSENENTDTDQKRQNRPQRPKTAFKNQKEKIEKIRELERQLEIVQLNISLAEANDLTLFVPIFGSPFYVGRYGRTGGVIFGGASQNYTYIQRFKIISIVDDDDSIVEFSVSEQPVWLHGISTKGLVTGSSIRTPPFLIITGTQDYENLMGAKQTVYVFEPLVIDPNYL